MMEVWIEGAAHSGRCLRSVLKRSHNVSLGTANGGTALGWLLDTSRDRANYVVNTAPVGLSCFARKLLRGFLLPLPICGPSNLHPHQGCRA